MEYDRPEWKAGSENRAPTAEQVKVMEHPAAMGVARRLQRHMGASPAKRYFTFTALTIDASEWGAVPPNWSLKPYIETLVDVGVLEHRTSKDGGFYYLPTPHTWPWVQVTLAEHKDT